MNKWKKWTLRAALALAALVVLAGAALLAGTLLAERKMNRQIQVNVKGVALRSDAAALARGRYLYASRGCVDCHGKNGAGRMFLDDGKGLRIAGPNITSGPGSVTVRYTAQDWERSIRHGISPTGRALMIMPSEDYNRLTDDDLASLVAWVRNLAAASGGGPVVDLPPPVKALYGIGLIPDAAEKINHALAPAQPVAEGVNLAHGAYVAHMCIGCHGANLAGGKIPGGPPEWPAAADLRPGAVMARYANADAFMKMFKTGKRADGSAVQVMPFTSLSEMSDTDVRALHLYLSNLPAKSGKP
ncbi:cytochrome c [Rhodoferax sp.]|uniref:c-type cytochrome n=1 Tax=Rhodoferax sp. TaxID=50421 RepID=UPI001EBB2EA8|nr:cytochrome c [Rhodoferax sp.]MBT9506484.1 c-type cytochrome [Rhodoferax sp.]